MKHALAILAALMLLSGPAWAKTCKKGIPCGKTCIAATKTCRK